MGPVNSSGIDVRVTDRKSLIKEQCLKRKPYESYQHRYIGDRPVGEPHECVGGENSLVFMESGILSRVTVYLFGGSLIRAFEVCPLWFVVFYKALDRIFNKIDTGFKLYYVHSLQLEYARTDWAPVHVAVSRTRLHAEVQGIVPAADRILGSRFEVLPKVSPIILPLKRVGLQHDRFTKIQLRQGDNIELYISQGGKMT